MIVVFELVCIVCSTKCFCFLSFHSNYILQCLFLIFGKNYLNNNKNDNFKEEIPMNNRKKNSIETSQRVPHTGTNSTRGDLAS